MAEIKFPIPEGFKPPADTQDKQEFDSLATFRLEGGELCLVAVDGVELGEAESPAEEEAEGGEEEDFIGSIEKGLAGSKTPP